MKKPTPEQIYTLTPPDDSDIINMCQQCGVNSSTDEHKCPYKSEINNDHSLCNCCSTCCDNCADDI